MITLNQLNLAARLKLDHGEDCSQEESAAIKSYIFWNPPPDALTHMLEAAFPLEAAEAFS